MTNETQPMTITELVGAKLFRSNGRAIDPWDSIQLASFLSRGQWHDGSPIDPWQREALRLLLEERSPLWWEVPQPVPTPEQVVEK